jgi:hypothetical protein
MMQKDKLNRAENHRYMDRGNKNPTWASVTSGTWICLTWKAARIESSSPAGRPGKFCEEVVRLPLNERSE